MYLYMYDMRASRNFNLAKPREFPSDDNRRGGRSHDTQSDEDAAAVVVGSLISA